MFEPEGRLEINSGGERQGSGVRVPAEETCHRRGIESSANRPEKASERPATAYVALSEF